MPRAFNRRREGIHDVPLAGEANLVRFKHTFGNKTTHRIVFRTDSTAFVGLLSNLSLCKQLCDWLFA